MLSLCSSWRSPVNALRTTSSEKRKRTSDTDASDAPSAPASPPIVRTADWTRRVSMAGTGSRRATRATLVASPLAAASVPAAARPPAAWPAAVAFAPAPCCSGIATIAVTLAPSRPRCIVST